MSNVIGPISAEEWRILKDIKATVAVQQQMPDPHGLLAEGIRKEREISNYILNKHRH